MADRYKYAGPDDYVEDYRNNGVDRAFDVSMGGPRVAFRKLKKAVDVLPSRVNSSQADGGVIGILEHQLKDAVEDAQEELKGLHDLADILKRERLRCEENLEILGRDRRQIQSETPQEYYSQATERQAENYNTVLAQQRIVMELISAMESLLREAVQRMQDAEADGASRESAPAKEGGKRGDAEEPETEEYKPPGDDTL